MICPDPTARRDTTIVKLIQLAVAPGRQDAADHRSEARWRTSTTSSTQ